MPPLPLFPPAHGLLRGCKMDYSDPPGLLRRRAMPRIGKLSVPLGLVAGTPRYAARHRLPCPPVPLHHLCLENPSFLFSIAITIITATIAVVVIAIGIIGGGIIINNGCGHAAE
ncbi:hypothetical protein RLOC_00012931 [Lonchura striata]|uniref:Uncharacterized protein n=1 Tax=Lonchura striata TaxID=40157 RepID=A0A218V097_9PASE|nr:hypothetical protein RLOC_00012931 [Lonchura striata domestica]